MIRANTYSGDDRTKIDQREDGDVSRGLKMGQGNGLSYVGTSMVLSRELTSKYRNYKYVIHTISVETHTSTFGGHSTTHVPSAHTRLADLPNHKFFH